MIDPKNCRHLGLTVRNTSTRTMLKPCFNCGKTADQLFENPAWINPLTKVSQQPHGHQILYCNMCEMYVKPTSFDGQNNLCPYHQRLGHSEEGDYLMYDEFNQDGEEL